MKYLILLFPLVAFAIPHKFSPQEAMEVLAEGDYMGLAEGKHPEKSFVHKFGSNLTVGTTLEPITTSGTYQTPTVAQTVEILSSSVNDTAAGSGARTVEIEGLDANWNEIEEVVTMNGTTPVVLSNTFLRIYRMYIITSGTYASTAGASHNSTITVRGVGGGATWGEIVSDGGFGYGQSQIGVYTCPKGKQMWILNVVADVESAKTMDLILYARQNADTVTAPYSPMRVINVEKTSSGELQHPIKIPRGPYNCPADIGFMGKVASGTASAEVYMELLMKDVE